MPRRTSVFSAGVRLASRLPNRCISGRNTWTERTESSYSGRAHLVFATPVKGMLCRNENGYSAGLDGGRVDDSQASTDHIHSTDLAAGLAIRISSEPVVGYCSKSSVGVLASRDFGWGLSH